jgi:cobaltochelatase CobN
MKRGATIVAGIERNSATLRRKPAEERRVAIVIADGAEPVAVEALRALAGAGYRVGSLPPDDDALARLLRRASPNADDAEELSRADYSAWFASLPRATQDAVAERWGTPEQDPAFRPGRLDCGTFTIPAARLGNIAVALPPSRPDNAVPRHGELALHAWLQDGFRADAVVRLDRQGDVEFIPPLSRE